MTTQASLDSIQQIYVAYLGRPGDQAGFLFWAQRLDETDLTEILFEFGNSREFLDSYGDMENEALIHSLYQQMFNRDADPEGLAFYLNRLKTGEASLTSIPKQIIDGAERASTDAQIFDNKIMQANCLTDQWYELGADITQEYSKILDAVGLEVPLCLRAHPVPSAFLLEEIVLTGISVTDNLIIDHGL